jgi:uncharacterized protein
VALPLSPILLIMTPHRLERLLVYYPTKTISADPSGLGLAYKELSLTTDDRVRLHGWFIPSVHSNRTMIVFNGNAGNIGDRLPWINILHGLQIHILMVDYRGYGNSEGEPYEEGLYCDARAVYEWWFYNRKPDERLILMGESLGGAVAVDLAAQVAPSGLILQSTFTNAKEMARSLFLLRFLRPLAGIQFNSLRKIKSVTCPKLFIHGNRDEIVPYHLGKSLYEHAPEPKTLYEVAGAGHNDLLWIAASEYEKRLHEFLKQIP